MRNKIAFTMTALGLLVLALVVYLPASRPARATGIYNAMPSTLQAREAAKIPHGIPASPQSPSATGDLVGTVTFSQDCSSGIGVGVAYDGAGHLWVSCYASNPDLLRASATTGVVDQTYNIQGGLGSLAYDATRNALWAGYGGGSDCSNIWLIQLDATKSVSGSSAQFAPTAGTTGFCLDDGIAFDASDDSLYYSDDSSTIIGHYTTSGTLLGSFPWTGTDCYNSGLAIGGSLLFQGSDGCSHVWVVDKTTLVPAFDFSTVVPGDPNFRDEGLSCDTDTFAGIGTQVMWSKEAYSPNRAAAFEIPPGTCGVGGVTANRCPLTQGYWKNHPSAWPVTSLTLGCQTYTQAELLAILNTAIGKGSSADASLILADQLIAAKLNIANGSDPTPISATITAADALLCTFGGKLPYHVKPSSMVGQQMTALAATLDAYNNGLLTPNCTP